jgi:hypothetical protein
MMGEVLGLGGAPYDLMISSRMEIFLFFSFWLKVTLSAGENRDALLHVRTAISTSSIARAQRMIGINATIAIPRAVVLPRESYCRYVH